MSKENKIEYGAGDTRVDTSFKLAKDLDLPGDLYFKREDANPTGSYKDRSLPVWIEKVIEEDPNAKFVISSSGNAAVAAAASCLIKKRPLRIYLSDQGDQKKLYRLNKLLEGSLKVGKWPFKSLAVNLQEYSFGKVKDKLKIVQQNEIDSVFDDLRKNIEIIETKKPKKEATLFSNEKKAIYLRSSIDDWSVIGYRKIADELLDKIGEDISDIFLPASSGSGAVGVYQGFKNLFGLKKVSSIPRLHICQTVHCHSLVINIAEKAERREDKTIASAICDHIAYRRKQVEEIVRETKGQGYILSNNQIRRALYTVQQFGQSLGIEGALAMAGIEMARKRGIELGRKVVCLNTGK